jgi:hypothetical protein
MATGSKAAFGRDPFFGKPFVDTDEWLDEPRPHRYVHGGFEGTETRFSFYFPPEPEYGGRFVHMLMGGTGGIDRSIAGPALGGAALVGLSGGLDMYFDFGAYAVESNQGHTTVTGVSYDMPGLQGQGSILSYRANAECARFAAALATEMYGAEPHHGYAFGGSGGGLRSVKAIEYAPGVYDGVAPFMIPPPILVHALSVNANAARAIRHQRAAVIDALEPGGSGDPYATLASWQRDALANAYAHGFSKQATWLLNMMAGGLVAIIGAREGAPEYVEAFWSERGYGGADGELDHVLVDVDTSVQRVLTAGELLELDADDPMGMRANLAMVPKEMVVAFTVDPAIAETMFTGERIHETGGDGRQFRALGCVGDAVICLDPATPLAGLRPGDRVHVDNREHLAYSHFARHHVDTRYPEWPQPMSRGIPRYPQRPWADRTMDPPYFTEPPYTGRFAGKMIFHQHLVEGSPCSGHMGDFYASLVRATMGDRTDDHFRMWLTENAHHIPASMTNATEGPAANTRIIDYMGCIEQAIFHVIDWVENGVEPPASTPYQDLDGQITLPSSAAERKGIQPAVTASANGAVRADVSVGDEVPFRVSAEMPPGAGSLVSAHADFDGTGSYPVTAPEPDSDATRMEWTVRHTFERPGTYFPAFRVRSHRDGRRDAPTRSVENLGRVRVVVT